MVSGWKISAAKISILVLTILLSACYSSTVYRPYWEYTEAEINVVLDREGLRGIHGWGWQVGTMCYEYDRYKGWSFYGWPEGIDLLEEWDYLINGSVGPVNNSPYHW